MKHPYIVRVLGSSIGLILALLFVGAIGSASANQLAQSAVGFPAARSGVNAPESVPVSSTFTYQGRLGNNGAPVTGTCDLAFRLFDDPGAGNLVGSPITLTAVSVVDGYFSVGLNFGSSAFTGSARWLDVRVRCPVSSGSFTTLAPRQAVTAAPYALAPWVTNGSTLYYNSGNVGIGTTTPTNKLTVQTATANYGLIHTDGTISVGTWVGTGGSSPAGGWFGTKTNHPLHFFVNDGGPSITISTTGDVGIGTSTPSAKLSVVKDGAPEPSVSGVPAGLKVGTWPGTIPLALKQNAVESGQPALLHLETGDGNLGYLGANSSTFVVGASTGKQLGININGATRAMTIDTIGNVGIGTSSPQRTVHVSSANSGLRLQSTDSHYWTTTEYQTDSRLWHTGVGGSAVSNDVKGKYYILDGTASQFRMVVDTSGNVGIGRTNPDAKLAVRGDGTNPILRVDLPATEPALYINSTGDVGIGAGSPVAKLDVRSTNGAIAANFISDGAIGLQVRPAGEVAIGVPTRFSTAHACFAYDSPLAYFAQCSSAAEYVPSMDGGKGYPETANLVSIAPGVTNPYGDTHSPFTVQKSSIACDSNLLGFIVDPKLGANGKKLNDHYLPLSIYGYFPAKVTLENGVIHRGDPLTSSSKPGYAMKATQACKIIGYALEDANTEGIIQVFAHLSENTAPQVTALTKQLAEAQTVNTKLEARVNQLEQQTTGLTARLSKLEQNATASSPSSQSAPFSLFNLSGMIVIGGVTIVWLWQRRQEGGDR